ncbi:MAG: hypothetical protein H6Q26_552 [Bacteroidetes bacterium]|uniref:hypothetical protein n=1 Tax=unclassified Chitinophaga TaxID=2619133 RepID=UPI00117C48AA|nr:MULTISPECIES: hypothetical protein [unclassified Chitinophaga]MBP1650395.1 hypothetical protein [Bacteroidota bacterium]WPV69369.1 hypothetical protein QQL36_11715 [Chitinophaga sp. LS1]
MKKIISSCLGLFFFISAAMAQKGDWYTWSTGTTPAVHVTINGDEIVLDRTDPATKQGGISGRKSNDLEAEHLKIIKKVEKNDRTYLIFQSFDGLYFVTTLQKSPSGDSVFMYCADGIEDGYKGLNEALDGIKKDNGSNFYITLFKKEVIDAEKRKVPVSKITGSEFGTALQTFTDKMDKFWQDRGYGHFEPYHGFMNLIYGNAFANAFGNKYSKLSLITKELKTPIANYSNNPNIRKLLESAGFLKSE